MAKSRAVARVLAGDRVECRVVTPSGAELVVSGPAFVVEGQEPHLPDVEGPRALRENQTLVNNAWAFAEFTHKTVTLADREQQQDAERFAKAHRLVAEWIADLADNLTQSQTYGWCSSCFGEHLHHKVNRPVGQLPVHLCSGCGAATLPCAGPGCDHMATRTRGAVRVPRFCAEHRHDISGFAKADRKMGGLEEYETFLEYEQPNLASRAKLGGAAIASVPFVAGAAFFGAAAIGGAVGSMLGGYSGAAATSYGLALLGGGSLATGGLGMAGGTVVVTALGGALGGVLGAGIAHAYFEEDKSFRIAKLRGGDGVPVVVCNGFLTEGGIGWGEWEDLVTHRYPDSPVYRVQWGAKELKDLAFFAGGGSGKAAVHAGVMRAAAKAAKAGAKRLNGLAPAFVATGLAKNPWHVAKNRADKTGVIVADLLARTEADSYVLIGHSLGARAMVVAAQTLGSKPDGPRIQTAHLLGAAIGAKSDWHTLTGAVDTAVYNYHSTNDATLRWAYGLAQGGQKAAGLVGFRPEAPKLKNIDVSEEVAGHSEYFSKVTLV